MNGSGTIQVLKRDGAAEPFDSLKLAAAMWQAIGRRPGQYERAQYLSDAVHFYLVRGQCTCCSSAALFEMCVRVLQYVGYRTAAEAWQIHRSHRAKRRRELRIRHDNDRVTLWDKNWLADFAAKSWRLSRRTARIFAAQIESDLLQGDTDLLDRHAVIERLNDLVAMYGLADAVPAQQD